MTDPEAEVLNRIKSLGGPVRAENLSDSEADVLRTLVIRGYVERDVVYLDHNIFKPVYVYTVTDAGRLALQAHEDMVKKEAQRKTDADRKEAAQDAKAAINRKKQFHHDFKVAAFTVILTLCLEHIGDIFEFVNHVLEYIRRFVS